MHIRVLSPICLIVAFFIVFLAASGSLAEQTLVLGLGEKPRCENLTLSGKPSSEGYKVANIWVQREGIVAHALNNKAGIICFSPLGVGSTRVKVSGEVFEYETNGELKSRKRFFRNFRIRVRPAKTGGD